MTAHRPPSWRRGLARVLVLVAADLLVTAVVAASWVGMFVSRTADEPALTAFLGGVIALLCWPGIVAAAVVQAWAPRSWPTSAASAGAAALALVVARAVVFRGWVDDASSLPATLGLVVGAGLVWVLVGHGAGRALDARDPGGPVNHPSVSGRGRPR